jgi:hypothetical protein
MLTAVAGIAAEGGRVFVYDGPAGRVWVTSDDLRPIHSFGGGGQGPGELRETSDRSVSHGASWRWLATATGDVLVYDGALLHRFTPDGVFIDRPLRWRGAPGLWVGTRRIAAHAGRLVYGNGGRDLTSLGQLPDRPIFRVYESGDDPAAPVLSLEMVPLPRLRDGATFTGPDQARPLWDLRDGCLIASDGTGTSLVRTAIGSGQVDTLSLSLPPHADSRRNADGEVAEYLGEAVPPPTARRKLESMMIDPDGYVWLLPVSSARGPMTAYVVSGTSGQVDSLLVPAFPQAFGSPGSLYAVVRDSFDVPVVARYSLHPAR